MKTSTMEEEIRSIRRANIKKEQAASAGKINTLLILVVAILGIAICASWVQSQNSELASKILNIETYSTDSVLRGFKYLFEFFFR